MKNFIISLTTAFLFIGLNNHQASATEDGRVKSLLFTCNVSFSAKGTSTYLGVGYTSIKGAGYINCYDYVYNVIEKIPIDVEIKGPGVGLGITGLNISGAAAGIGLNESPEALLGNYLAVRGNAAVGVGAGVGANLRVAKDSFNIGLDINAASGLGAGIDILSVKLSRSKKLRPERISLLDKNEPIITEAINTPVTQVRAGEIIDIVDESGARIKRIRIKLVP